MLVIGNGESRRGIDIDKILDKKIGCNAIHRDFFVDHLICVDRRMVQEAIDEGVNYNSLVYTRTDWAGDFSKAHKRIREVPDLPYVGSDRWDEPFQWGSGPYAVLLGAKLSENVNLIGFDLYSETDTINNVYKDTKGYDAGTKRPVDPRYWIHQIGKVFEIYSRRKFTIYQKGKWILPKAWQHSNVSLDNIANI
jgi:hypothetical protein